MHPGLNLINLKFFCDAAACESVSEAAKSNFVTQSAISQGIQKLEKAIGAQLTTHQRHRFKLTDDGYLVLAKAQAIFKVLREMQEDVSANAQVVQGQLHLACPPSMAMPFILPTLKKVKTSYPLVSVHFRLGNIDVILGHLKSRRIDFGIVLDSPDFDMYEKHSLYTGEFQVYTKKGKISDGVLVDRFHGLNVDKLKENYRRQYSQELLLTQELDSWDIVARFVENNMGCGFFPDYLLERNQHPGLKPVTPTIEAIPYNIVAIYPKGDKLSRQSLAFLEIFRN